MLGIGKKKDDKPAGPVSGMGLPTEKVMSLSSQGMSEPEIIKKLREEGHTPLEVDRAMKDAMRAGAGANTPQAAPHLQQPAVQSAPHRPAQPPVPQGPSPEPVQPMQLGPPLPQPEPEQPRFDAPPGNKFAPTDWGDDDLDDNDFNIEKFPAEKKMGPGAFMAEMDEKIPDLPEEPETMGPEPLPFTQAPLPKEKDDRVRALKDRRRKEIEELTEEITEEKWKDIMSRIQLLEENLEKLSGDIKNTSTQTHGGTPDELNSLRGEFANQKESIEETNARIDSLEEVVKSSLTPMLDSVRKFNRMTKAPVSHTVSATPASHTPPGPSAPQAPEPTDAPRYSPKAAEK